MNIPNWAVAGFNLAGALFLVGLISLGLNFIDLLIALFFLIANSISFTWNLSQFLSSEVKSA